MPPKFVATKLTANQNLSQRWPDADLSKSFSEVLRVYQRLSEAQMENSCRQDSTIRAGYETICRWMQDSLAESAEGIDAEENSRRTERITVRSVVLNLKAIYGEDWLQRVASLLGMLMHFSEGRPEAKLLVNHRRPRRPFSTYPNSPAVAKFLADAAISYLLKEPIPNVCQRAGDAERYAERALWFRVLDPSMESGQLLLEVARASIRQVLHKHSASSRTARYLSRALLEKLCRDCLWGIDRNELAAMAVKAVFILLGAELGIQQLSPVHLITADALEYFNQGELSQFDGIVNNPPWGQVMRPSEREQPGGQLSTLQHQSETCVAFGELAIRCLRPEGVFALILPSQAVATRNTARLRSLFLNKTELDQMILLPRAAFADATVRGLVLLGRTKPTTPSAVCRVTTYPVVKRFDSIGPARSFSIRKSALRAAGQGSWWPLLSTKVPERLQSEKVSLEQVACVISGVHLHRKGDGIPPQTAEVVRERPFTLSEPAFGTVPAIRGRDVREFHLSDPQQFIKFGRWLAWIGNHDSLRRSTRIFVRELCRRDGKLSAAVARDGFIPLHGVLTVVPKMINVYALVGVLNSVMAADYVSKHTASFSKVDFQKITVGELRQMPIPIAAIGPGNRSSLGLHASTEREVSLHRRLVTLARNLSHATTINNSKTEKLSTEMNAVILAMFDLSEDENA